MKLLTLSQGLRALVDDEDFERLNAFKWTATCNPNGRRPGSAAKWYAHRKEAGKTIYLHREIMRTRKGLVANHLCANGLDCRKSNMHNCTQKTNVRHTYQGTRGECECWILTGIVIAKSKEIAHAEIAVPNL